MCADDALGLENKKTVYACGDVHSFAQFIFEYKATTPNALHIDNYFDACWLGL